MNHINSIFKVVFFAFFAVLCHDLAKAQTTLSADGFENSLTDFTVTSGSAAYASGNTGSADFPAFTPYATAGTYAFTSSASTTVLTSKIISTQNFSGVSLSFRLAAIALNSTSQGLDATDNVTVALSTDGGATFTNYLTVSGNSQAVWGYSSGTATATATYPTAATASPAGGGARTTDGYSKLVINSIPQNSNIVVRITMLNSNTSEVWAIDDYKMTGTATCTNPTTGITNLSVSNITNGGFDASWTNGGSNKRLISLRATSNLQSIPVAGTSYTGNTAWASADQINTNNRVIYTGALSTVTGVSGLNPQTNYTVNAFEYTNNTSCYFSYNWATTNFYTLSNPATAHATAFTGTGVSGSQIDLSWTAATWPASGATAKGYVIIYRTDGTNPSATGVTDGVASGSLSFPAGTTLLTTINSGTTTSFSHTGLPVSQNVRYLLVPFTWDGTNAATINYYTTATIPTCSATTLSVAAPTISSANLSNVYVGSSITITGTSFTNISSVTVGGVTASYSTSGSTQMTITVPSGISNANISVTNITGTANYNLVNFSGYITTSSSSYTSGAAWLGGVQPPAGSDITIAHVMTVSGSNAINAPRNITILSGGSITTAGSTIASNSGTITINSGGALTLGANSSWTSSSSISNSGAISFSSTFPSTLTIGGGSFTNNATLTIGAGTIATTGTVSLTGATTFNNLTLGGATTLPAGAIINGNLTLNAGGSIVTNSPTYGPSATLTYGKSSTGTGLEWIIGATVGTAGSPENVVISSGTLNLNGTGTYYVDGNLTMTGSLTMSGSSLLQVSGNMTGGGTFTHGNRKVIFAGASQSVSNTITFYDVDVNSTNLTMSGTIVINNKLTILASSTLTNSGTLTISSTAATPSLLNGTLVNMNTLSIGNTGGLVMNSGSTYVHNTTNSAANLANGNMIKNTGSTFIYRGSSLLASSVVLSAATFANLRIESTSGTWSISPSGSSAWNVTGDLYIGANVNMNGSTYSGNLTLAGNITVDGTMPSTNPINAILSGTQDTISGAGTIRFGTLTVSGKYQLNSGMTVNTATVNGSLFTNGNIVSGTTFTLGSTGTLGIGHNQGITSSGNQGNIQTTNRTFPTTASYIYNGTASQVAGSGLPATVANLTVNNTGTGANNMVTLAQTTTVTNTLNLLDGHFAATGSIELIVANTAANAITGYASMALANNSSYVEGNLRRKVTTGVYDFPLGTSQNYQLATITVNSNTNVNNILVHFDKFASGCGYAGNTPSFYAKPANGSRSTLVDDMLNFGYYTVEPYDATYTLVTAPNISYDAQMLFNGHTNGVAGYSNVNSYYTLMKKPVCGGAWGLYGGSFSTTNNQAQNSNSGSVALKLQGLVSFSQFGGGFSSGTVLPLEMTGFTGEQRKDGNALTWTTLSEESTIKFVIERSENADDFTAIGEVAAKGARNSGADYSFLDAKAGTGIHYYRLKAVDVDGNSSYSEMIALGSKGNISNFNVYPNPAANEIHFSYELLQANTQATLKVYSMTGALMHAETLTKNTQEYLLDTRDYQNGLYFYEVVAGGQKLYTGKFNISK